MKHRFIVTLGLLAAIQVVHGSSIRPLTIPERVQNSDAILRGTAVAATSFKSVDGLIYTRTSLRVDESIMGTFPEHLAVVHRGGRVDGEDEFAGYSPKFVMGSPYLVFISRNADGTLSCVQGAAGAMPLHANKGGFIPEDEALLESVRDAVQEADAMGTDVTDQAGQSGGAVTAATTGMLGGVNSRFLAPDRGEGIPVLIDADSLPAGITLAQATNAVLNALNAWTAVTSLKFQYGGVQSFGQGADAVTNRDETIRIQLHDNYNRINSANVLGIGGRASSTGPLPGTSWDIGGNVAGNEFLKTARGYVVLESTDSTMENLSTFTEVLCHEVGHVLNMAHSSEITTNDPVLVDSIMYYLAHADGRGATLGSYDPPVIQQVYPFNPPPFAFNRMLDVVTSSLGAPNVAGINEVSVLGFDLQDTNLTVLTNNGTAMNGSFSLVGNTIKYASSLAWSYNGRSDPTGNSQKDWIYFRVSDGTNASPFMILRVLSFDRDTTSPSSDGIPDRWVSLYFPSTISATADADGDGLNNRQEYIAGSNPTNAASAQFVSMSAPGTIQWQAKAYELYEILGSTDLTNWARVGVPVIPTNGPIEVLTNNLGTNIIATVTNLPATNQYLFYRVRKVP